MFVSNTDVHENLEILKVIAPKGLNVREIEHTGEEIEIDNTEVKREKKV